ncbi:hypothetical protein [Pseudocitrobacter cyperus]|uniref:Lysine-N-methylase n=1 Tax=Pseudocitrobacter cyperus TaxID=3112843 RepID=A0ABV0HHA7_9ENTR
MESIEHYHPEFVKGYAAQESACTCLACRHAQPGFPYVSIRLKNQQRESLNLACETAARQALLNPEAFVLHTEPKPAESETVLDAWHEALNQHCINLAIHPALTLEGRLYAIGVLLSKAQQYRDQGEQEPALLSAMAEQLADLAEKGVLAQQFALLPAIPEHQVAALKEMGAIRLNLDVPMAEKMAMALKLSELAILSPSRLAERHQAMAAQWQAITLFDEQPWILTNALIYQLYHQVFPGIACDNYGEAFLALARDFFCIKMLCAIRSADNHQLTAEEAAMLVSAFEAWKQQHPFPPKGDTTADYSLLCGLSLL